MEWSFIEIYDFLLENPRWLESKNFFGQGKCPPSQKEGPRGVPGSATSNEGDQRRRGVGADAVPGSPGRQYQKTT